MERDTEDHLAVLREDNLEIMEVCSKAQQDLEDRDKEVL